MKEEYTVIIVAIIDEMWYGMDERVSYG